MSQMRGTQRVAAVLAAFADGARDIGVTELARHVGCSKSVVHRILVDLVASGFLVTDPSTRRYRLGPLARRLSVAAGEHHDLRSEALPFLHRIQERTGETATLSLLRGDARVYVDQVESRHRVRQTVHVGEEAPLHLGASGKAILAFMPEDEWPPVARTPTFAAELRRIRKRGYATSASERIPGASSVAAPVFDDAGRAIGSISAAGVVTRANARRNASHGAVVRGEARALSQLLGWRPRRASAD